MTDHHLITRAAAAQATHDAWKGAKLRLGHSDCVRMVADHLRRLGYPVRIPPKGAYAGPKGARKMLAERRVANIGVALDALGLERITPARAVVGDIIELPSHHDGLPALVVALGNGRVLGWHDDGALGAVVMHPLLMTNAWRAMPKTSAAEDITP